MLENEFRIVQQAHMMNIPLENILNASHFEVFAIAISALVRFMWMMCVWKYL